VKSRPWQIVAGGRLRLPLCSKSQALKAKGFIRTFGGLISPFMRLRRLFKRLIGPLRPL
jgi:hypothetical protein